MRLLPPGTPAPGGNACAGLDGAGQALRMALAARYLAAHGGAWRRMAAHGGATAWLETAGRYGERSLALLPAPAREARHARAGDGLAWAWQRATTGLDRAPTGRAGPAWLYRLLSAVSGAGTGAAGLPGLLADLSVSTLLVLRGLMVLRGLATMARQRRQPWTR